MLIRLNVKIIYDKRIKQYIANCDELKFNICAKTKQQLKIKFVRVLEAYLNFAINNDTIINVYNNMSKKKHNKNCIKKTITKNNIVCEIVYNKGI